MPKYKIPVQKMNRCSFLKEMEESERDKTPLLRSSRIS
jgi:hypothetical protein